MTGHEFDLEELSEIGTERANQLRAAGHETLDDIRQASMDELAAIAGISERLAEQIKAEVGIEREETVSGGGRPMENYYGDAAIAGFDHVSPENRPLLELSLRRERLRRFQPDLLTPVLLPPCEVEVLLVADDGIYFNERDFGLQTFVETLLGTPRQYVEFTVTLAHRSRSSVGSQTLRNHSRVSTIGDFDFSDSSHFTTDKYDQVWLFGFQSSGSEPSDEELRAISEFMDGGGGLFATGDHGALGKALCSEVPRARSMRRWDDSSGEVGMGDADRKDTNRSGHNTSSEFNDQSDDIPQPIEPKLYHQWLGIIHYSYPHPLLCGPDGSIRVMPDHPHEGECVEPTDTGRDYTFDGYTIEEYPPGAGGSPRPLPEVISMSAVPAGNTAAFPGREKTPTQSQKFGGICAYDGHRADVGRVVTDATWHHFLNINLVGDPDAAPTSVKRQGYLASASGQDHLDQIQAYYRNIAVWISRERQIRCMNTRTIWDLLWHHRVIEAVSTRPDVTFEMADAKYIYEVGRHARDVLGNYASECQSRRIAIDILRPHIDEELLARLDPWRPPTEEPRQPDPLPWVTPEPLLELALGGALIALREEFPEPDPQIRDEVEESFDGVVDRGVEKVVDMARESVDESIEGFGRLWEVRQGR
jgi:hypothetical protein